MFLVHSSGLARVCQLCLLDPTALQFVHMCLAYCECLSFKVYSHAAQMPCQHCCNMWCTSPHVHYTVIPSITTFLARSFHVSCCLEGLHQNNASLHTVTLGWLCRYIVHDHVACSLIKHQAGPEQSLQMWGQYNTYSLSYTKMADQQLTRTNTRMRRSSLDFQHSLS